MGQLETGLFLIGALIALVLLGMHIAIALFSVAIAGVWFLRENFELSMRLLSISAYNGVADFLFATIPLFVLMGLIVSISNIGRDTFDVANFLLRRLRGGLGVATVTANTVFAAVTGVSIASAAVFTKVAVPEMTRFGYRPAFAAGTVAGSSVLGMLIPPSLLLIIYGVLAEVSIGNMFIAGIIPGIMLALGFVAMIVALTYVAPKLVYVAGESKRDNLGEQRTDYMSWGKAFRKLAPIVVLVAIVLGGLYSGFFTPTEAGGVGAFGALVIAFFKRSLDWSKIWQVLKDTGTVSVTILILLIAASFYSRMLAVAGVPMAISSVIVDSGLGPFGFILVYIGIVFLAGMFLDSSSLLLIMVPIAAPIAQSLGFDLVHFGLITVIAVEIGLLTPPFGISVFAVHSTLANKSVSVESIFAGTLPFVGVMLLVLFLITLFPALSTALI
jgi:C4-dicarboxylate transporter, DctM subunit